VTVDLAAIRACIKAFDFRDLFIEKLGWDNPGQTTAQVVVGDTVWQLERIAHKRGFVVLRCTAPDGGIPEVAERRKLEGQVAKDMTLEHLIVFTDAAETSQLWQWASRRGGPAQYRTERFDRGGSGHRLAQRLQHLFISFDEEQETTVSTVTGKVGKAFSPDKVTRKFYDRFAKERKDLLPQISGIPVEDDRDWYASIMLNRLMFVYFIQQKRFLNDDPNYLRRKLEEVQQRQGRDQFYTFYREFLLKLFHDGLARQKPRPAEIERLLGDVPYLNGGIFEQHQIERSNPDIQIPDVAFERIFDFFDAYQWHLDDRPLRKDDEINPDVLGYIFEKYINQKQMGAYYTKEDITEYISKNTIIPFLFDAAKKDVTIAFQPGSALWNLLANNPDGYIYDAVQHGTEKNLPADIAAGLDDVAQRGGWNQPAADGFALPTETWREHVARRQRYEDIWQKMVAGEISSIDDLITYNLNIRQFAQDAIHYAEGPELVRAFFKAIQNVSVLDPTCGSGAFLFAALNILRPLYDACLERMAEFVDESDRDPERNHPQKFRDFRETLAEVKQHASREYYITKSIIIQNLYGVDIMEEAVEICKLRLFLTLAAELEPGDTPEPLPDIDFNIRAGNTLVGFATMDEVREAAQMDARGNRRLPLPEDMAALDRLEEQAAIAARAFEQFRAQQTQLGGTVTVADKATLRSRLRNLSDELDRYLARLYNIFEEQMQSSFDYQQRFQAWRTSHQPFHWLVDFYGIMQRGGFDVIIGNPPYVEYSKVRAAYRVNGYKTERSGNLYPFVIERSVMTSSGISRIGMIVPLGGFATARMDSYQEFLRKEFALLHLSHFSGDAHPSVMFEGVKYRLSIILGKRRSLSSSAIYTTCYRRWYADERGILFQTIAYERSICQRAYLRFGRIGDSMGDSIIKKITSRHQVFASYTSKRNKHEIHYHRSPVFWIRAMDFEPYFNSATRSRSDDHLKTIRFNSDHVATALGSIINSTIFYFWFHAQGNCRDITATDIEQFPLGDLNGQTVRNMSDVFRRLMDDLRRNSKRRVYNYRTSGRVEYDEFYPRLSKPIIDEIDRVLAEHYGFTDEELDFIINYDIKYRMGRDGLAAGGDE